MNNAALRKASRLAKKKFTLRKKVTDNFVTGRIQFTALLIYFYGILHTVIDCRTTLK